VQFSHNSNWLLLSGGFEAEISAYVDLLDKHFSKNKKAKKSQKSQKSQKKSLKKSQYFQKSQKNQKKSMSFVVSTASEAFATSIEAHRGAAFLKSIT
jgi:hypothetical protein